MNWPRTVANCSNWPMLQLPTEGVVLPPLIKDSNEHRLCSLIIFHISYLWIYGYLLWNMANKLFDELAVWNIDSLVSRVMLIFLAVNQDIQVLSCVQNNSLLISKKYQ